MPREACVVIFVADQVYTDIDRSAQLAENPDDRIFAVCMGSSTSKMRGRRRQYRRLAGGTVDTPQPVLDVL
jgi:hypothetical protein